MGISSPTLNMKMCNTSSAAIHLLLMHMTLTLPIPMASLGKPCRN
uniref:Uncharacterized protein n=1 Tax=Arundo donax TaxID=35708 RepID=A0A0A9E6P9_ARUDO